MLLDRKIIIYPDGSGKQNIMRIKNDETVPFIVESYAIYGVHVSHLLTDWNGGPERLTFIAMRILY